MVIATRHNKLKIVTIGLVSLFAIGTISMVFVEGWGLWKATYFAFVTLTTVGLGDVVPDTILGQLLIMTYTVFGLGFMNILFSTLSSKLKICQAFWTRNEPEREDVESRKSRKSRNSWYRNDSDGVKSNYRKK